MDLASFFKQRNMTTNDEFRGDVQKATETKLLVNSIRTLTAFGQEFVRETDPNFGVTDPIKFFFPSQAPGEFEKQMQKQEGETDAEAITRIKNYDEKLEDPTEFLNTRLFETPQWKEYAEKNFSGPDGEERRKKQENLARIALGGARDSIRASRKEKALAPMATTETGLMLEDSLKKAGVDIEGLVERHFGKGAKVEPKDLSSVLPVIAEQLSGQAGDVITFDQGQKQLKYLSEIAGSTELMKKAFDTGLGDLPSIIARLPSTIEGKARSQTIAKESQATAKAINDDTIARQNAVADAEKKFEDDSRAIIKQRIREETAGGIRGERGEDQEYAISYAPSTKGGGSRDTFRHSSTAGT